MKYNKNTGENHAKLRKDISPADAIQSPRAPDYMG